MKRGCWLIHLDHLVLPSFFNSVFIDQLVLIWISTRAPNWFTCLLTDSVRLTWFYCFFLGGGVDVSHLVADVILTHSDWKKTGHKTSMSSRASRCWSWLTDWLENYGVSELTEFWALVRVGAGAGALGPALVRVGGVGDRAGYPLLRQHGRQEHGLPRGPASVPGTGEPGQAQGALILLPWLFSPRLGRGLVHFLDFASGRPPIFRQILAKI